MTDERKEILAPEIAKKALKMQDEMPAGILEMEERNRRAFDNFTAFIAAHNYSSDELSKASATVPVTQGNKLRRNNLDPAIDKAIKQAGNMNLADVYLELKELALAGEKPFTGALIGDALCYTNDKNLPDKLTKNALGKKLKRRATLSQ